MDPTKTVGATEQTGCWTDGRTDGVKPVYPPTTSLSGGYTNYSNLVNYSQQQKSNMATRCGHFVKVTSLEITRLLIHAHKYRKSHCGCKTILRSSYLPIMGFPILVRNIFYLYWIRALVGSPDWDCDPGPWQFAMLNKFPVNPTMSSPFLFITSMGWCNKDETPLLTHWSYVFLALTHPYWLLCMLRTAN